ncbi:MAG: cob(I)yrinic acid a,c-diamide adenosyltransferase [Desulfotomaculum sp.]|nr:cob(I)yrinic acid a,c-diamide adenosyltransferase [Desulfotomaculum sp.]
MGASPGGLVLVYTGEGKGKTTAALGTALRAWGQGMRVLVLQFIKGNWSTGEQSAVKKLGNGFELRQVGDGFLDFKDQKALEKQKKLAREGLETARLAISSGQYQMVVLDEINYAVSYGLVDKQEVLEIIENKPPEMHLVLTGRNAPEEIITMADMVTRMENIKHHYNKGIPAQRGIEY